MKKLLTLLLLLIPFTAGAQDIDQARFHLEQALEILSEQPEPITAFTGTWEGEKLRLFWENQTDREIDIQYSQVGNQKVHSIQWMLHSPNYHPPVLEVGQESYTIGSPPNADYEIIVGPGAWNESEKWFEFTWTDTLFVPRRINLSPDPSSVYVGFWDHQKKFDFVNVGKSMSKSIGYIVNQGIPGIGIIEGFSEDRREIRDRLEDSRSFIQKFKPGSENLFTILTDEPFSEGKNAKIMEQMISDAKQIIGNDYEFGFSFKELAFRDDRELPQNADWIGINFYPFRHEGGAQTKQDFFDRLEYVYERAKEKAPNAKIFIVGQAFHGGKWIRPPLESPVWYAEFVQSHGVEVLLWWKWDSSSAWKGSRDMPDLHEYQKKAGKLLIGEQ